MSGNGVLTVSCAVCTEPIGTTDEVEQTANGIAHADCALALRAASGIEPTVEAYRVLRRLIVLAWLAILFLIWRLT